MELVKKDRNFVWGPPKFFCYMAYNAKKKIKTSSTVLFYCNQLKKNAKKGESKENIPLKGWNDIFFSLSYF